MTADVEVVEFSPTSTPHEARPRHPIPSARNLSSVIGIAGCILLHALAIPALIFGTIAHKPHRPDPEGEGNQRNGSPVAPAESLVLLTLADRKKPDRNPLDGAVPLNLRLEKVRVHVAAPSPMNLAIPDDLSADQPPATVDTGDPAERAFMFGRYTGQISARIERAWVRPSSPVNEAAEGAHDMARQGAAAGDEDPTFRCTVQIRQDVHGQVEEVLLLACDGSEEWRHSLVVAINQASPLPAPPTPKVFTRVLTMSFEGHTQGPGAAAQANEFQGR